MSSRTTIISEYGAARLQVGGIGVDPRRYRFWASGTVPGSFVVPGA